MLAIGKQLMRTPFDIGVIDDAALLLERLIGLRQRRTAAQCGGIKTVAALPVNRVARIQKALTHRLMDIEITRFALRRQTLGLRRAGLAHAQAAGSCEKYALHQLEPTLQIGFVQSGLQHCGQFLIARDVFR